MDQIHVCLCHLWVLESKKYKRQLVDEDWYVQTPQNIATVTSEFRFLAHRFVGALL